MEIEQEGNSLDHGVELHIVQKQGDILNPMIRRTSVEFMCIFVFGRSLSHVHRLLLQYVVQGMISAG